jgi:hypothetical protein
MREPQTADPPARGPRRAFFARRGGGARLERRLVAVLVALLVVFRSAVFVFWEQSQFDADQAITGLMAKHLVELRAFPVFYYGQTYMLAVEAWLTAPVFLLAGVSVTTLRLPLLGINIAIALLLLRVFEREVGLRPALAAVPTLFFALPAPGTAAQLLAANGGNVEPFAYVLLIWLTRNRPNWCGLIFGIGFLHREFTVYALAALLAIEAFQRTLFTRDGIRRRLVMLRTAAEVWLVVQWLKYVSSAAGPDTSMADLVNQRDNIMILAGRLCLEVQGLPAGAWRLVTDHWPILFGTRVQPIVDFGVDTTVSQGLPYGSLLLAGALLLAAGGIGFRLLALTGGDPGTPPGSSLAAPPGPATRRWRREYDVCAYLVLVALFSTAGYVIGRCGDISLFVLRYELLSLIGAAGLGAWFLRAHPSRTAVRAWIALACACAAISALAHGRLLAEYLSHAPVSPKRSIARHLEARGIRYATSDYWLAYPITFLTNERVVVASDDVVRIQEYQRLFEGHRSEAVRISRGPCPGGRLVVTGVYFCPPQ